MRSCNKMLLALVGIQSGSSWARPRTNSNRAFHIPPSPSHAISARDLLNITTGNVSYSVIDTLYGQGISVAGTQTDDTKGSEKSIHLTISVENNLDGSNGPLSAWVTGLEKGDDGSRRWIMLDTDQNWYYPENPSKATPQIVPSSSNTKLTIDGTTNFTLPGAIYAARIWFSIKHDLQFCTVSTANTTSPFGMVFPNVANPTDVNSNITWSFAEFSVVDGTLYANPSQVDFAAIPIGLRVSSGTPNYTPGLRKGAKESICDSLKEQAAKDNMDWDKLCMRGPNNEITRVLAPKTYLSMHDTSSTWPGFPSSVNSPLRHYFDDTVTATYSYWRTHPPTFKTNIGTYNCSYHDPQTLYCGEGDLSFLPPSTSNIFSCADGSLFNGGSRDHRAVIPILCAGFMRGTLTLGGAQPVTESDKYYVGEEGIKFDYYSKFVHENHGSETGGESGYAFAYDDVDDRSSGALKMEGGGTLTFIVGGAD